MQDLVHWLVSRQTATLADYRDFDEGTYSDGENEGSGKSGEQGLESSVQQFSIQRSMPVPPSPDLEEQAQKLEAKSEDLSCAGFNGRCNKPADTCYSFWAGGSLSVHFTFSVDLYVEDGKC